MAASPTPIRAQPRALAGAAKSSHTFQKAAQVAALRRKAIQTRLAPAHSALVRQKGLAGKDLKSVTGQLTAAKGAAKGALGKELAQVKKAALPTQHLAAKDAAALKKAMALQHQAALKAMAPAHSALVSRKNLLGQQLAAGKSTIGKDMTGIKKTAQQSHAAQLAKKARAAGKKAGAAANQTEQRGFGRLLRKIQSS